MTPGHRGKDCARLFTTLRVWWSEDIQDFVYGSTTWPREAKLVSFCPLCGIELKPDPEPLPVPEGFKGTVESFEFNMCGWCCQIGDTEMGRRRWIQVVDATQPTCEALWRKLFTK